MDYFIGEIRAFPYHRELAGWLLCDGRSLPVEGRYELLFEIIGTRFGGDAAKGTFNLPDLRSTVVAGAGGAAGPAELGVVAGNAGQPALAIAHFICVAGVFGPAPVVAPFTLKIGQKRHGAGARHSLMLDGGQAVVRARDGRVAWRSGGTGGTRLTLQADGELVLTDDAGAVAWRTRATGRSQTAPVLEIGEDGHLTIKGSEGTIWRSHIPADGEVGWLPTGQEASREQPMVFPPSRHRLIIPTKKEAFLQDARGTAAWWGPGGDRYREGRWVTRGRNEVHRIVFGNDGNLTFYDFFDKKLWQSDTAQPGSAGEAVELHVNTENELVITVPAGNYRRTIWSSRGGPIFIRADASGQTPPADERDKAAFERKYPVGSRLDRGKRLAKGETLRSANGRFLLELADAGGMVLKTAADGKVVWDAGIVATGVAELSMQTDYNCVLHGQNGAALWSRGFNRWEIFQKDACLVLEDDGELALFRDRIRGWSSGSAPLPGRLPSGQRMSKGDSIRSPNGAFVLTFGEDGTLFHADREGNRIWQCAMGPTARQLQMRHDGNLVLADAEGKTLWESRTAYEDRGTVIGGLALCVEDDGRLYIRGRQPNCPAWVARR